MKNMFSKIVNRFNNTFFKHYDVEEAYLNEAVDLVDLEHRIRELDRNNGSWMFKRGY